MTIRELRAFLLGLPGDNKVLIEDENGTAYVPEAMVAGGPDGHVLLSPICPVLPEDFRPAT